MRLLLDESLPRLLSEQLTEHEATTVQSLGWAGVGNGELLRLAAAAGFEALVTADRGFEFEQNPETLPVMVVVLRARSNRLEDLEPLVAELLSALSDKQDHRLLKIGSP